MTEIDKEDKEPQIETKEEVISRLNTQVQENKQEIAKLKDTFTYICKNLAKSSDTYGKKKCFLSKGMRFLVAIIMASIVSWLIVRAVFDWMPDGSEPGRTTEGWNFEYVAPNNIQAIQNCEREIREEILNADGSLNAEWMRYSCINMIPDICMQYTNKQYWSWKLEKMELAQEERSAMLKTKCVRGTWDTLEAGKKMLSGQYLESKNGRLVLIMQEDGNLVLYDLKNHNHEVHQISLHDTLTTGSPIWSSAKSGPRPFHRTAPFELSIGVDNHLSIRDSLNNIVWEPAYSEKASGKGGSLVLENSKSLVLKDGEGKVRWRSKTEALFEIAKKFFQQLF